MRRLRAGRRDALELPGVRQIAVDLDTGLVDVTHVAPATAEAMASAIEDTGYEVREAHAA